jgi:hypothetical protein
MWPSRRGTDLSISRPGVGTEKFSSVIDKPILGELRKRKKEMNQMILPSGKMVMLYYIATLYILPQYTLIICHMHICRILQ